MNANIEAARRVIPAGSTVHTILRHVSRSGMTRVISTVVVDAGQAYTFDHLVADALGRKVDQRHSGVKCHGAGMDMGFELVYSLGMKLYGDGYALRHRWL